MKLENLKNEYPAMPEHIRNMIEQEVNNQMHTAPKVRHKGIRKITWKKAAVIALAATMALATTTFAGVKLYQWQMEKEGNYGLKAGIVVDDSANSGEGISIPEEIPTLSIEPAYLPEGVIAADDGSDKYFYESNPWKGGFSIGTITMDEEFSEDNLLVSDTSVTASETVRINGMDGIYLEKAGFNFDKKLYIAYPEYWQIVEIYIGNDVTREEALKVAENLKISPTGETTPLSEAYTWSDRLTEEAEMADTEMKTTAAKDEMKNLHKVGDSFELTNGWEAEDSNESGLQVKVSKIEIADDRSLLKDEYMDSDLAAAFDSTGKLIKNKIQYTNTGDGIDSIDEEIWAEEVNQKLVYVTAEYTNTGDTELNDVLFLCGFVGMIENDEGYILYDRAMNDDNDETDTIITSSIGGLGEMDYYDIRGGERGNNYIPVIQPGETVTVNIAKIVNEDELDKMFLSFDPSGAVYEFTECTLQTGYVDARSGADI